MIDEKNITIIIPFFRSNIDRFLNLKCVLDSLSHTNISVIVVEQKYNKHTIEKFIAKFYPNVQYIQSNLEISMINKSMLVNTGVNHANTNYIWQLDSDVVLKWQKILESIPENKDIIKPFEYIVKLTKEESIEYRKNGRITIKKGDKRDTVKKFGPMSFIIKKEIYLLEGGMDERFEGWSWEDIAFANKITKKYDVYTCNNIYGAHLFHPPAVSNENINHALFYSENDNNRSVQRIDSYNKLQKKDIGIIIGYFSPCNFQMPRQNIYTIVQKLLDADYPVTVVEAVMPGSEKLSFPNSVKHKQINAKKENIIFQKEALLNIGASICPYDKLLFLDADIEFDDPDWLNKASSLLDSCDIIQPYDVAIWLDKTNKSRHIARISGAKAIADKIQIHGAKQHPGFSWGMTRNTFNKLGGFYHYHPLGGSDTILWFSIIPEDPPEGLICHWVITNEFFKNTKSYVKYRDNAQSHNFKIGYIDNCTVLHLYHGSLDNRQYVDRNFKYMPDMEDGEFPVKISKNGLLAWKYLKDAENCLRYFQSRMEDN